MPRPLRTEAAANIALANTTPTPHRPLAAPAPKGWSLPLSRVLVGAALLVGALLAYPYVMGV